MGYKKSYIRSVLWCVIPLALTVAVNVLCLVLRTDGNHNWMLVINLLTDWLCGVFLVYYTSCYMAPRKELYRLSCRRGESLSGVIDKVDERVVRYERLNCVAVYIGKRQVFAPDGLKLPQVGEEAAFFVAGNVILEVTR